MAEKSVDQDKLDRIVAAARRAQDERAAAYREKVVKSDRQQISLISFVPLVLVLMTITGAVYPAIDLTAGERERGTLEIGRAHV
mgnify:CR=1 FL=1